MALWGLTSLVTNAPTAKAQDAAMPVVKSIDVFWLTIVTLPPNGQ